MKPAATPTEAGEKAGEAAGAKAGAEAGKVAGEKAANMNKFSPPVTDADWDRFEKSDPGAVGFFKEFDDDNDKHLSRSEWVKVVEAAKERNFLDHTFDGDAQWNAFPKTEELKVNLRDFLGWASKTPSHEVPAEAKLTPEQKAHARKTELAKHCGEVFKTNDLDSNSGLDLKEFKTALNGKIDEDEMEDAFMRLARTGPGRTLTLSVFAPFCSQLTGLPEDQQDKPSETQKKDQNDPCSGEPCKDKEGTVCIADIKTCVKEPCPQFKCVEKDAGSAEPELTNEYGKCSNMFSVTDTNKDGVITAGEFKRGVAAHQAAGNMIGTFSATSAWTHIDKLDAQDAELARVNIRGWMHFCVAVLEEGSDAGGSAKEECWDVFTHFDADQSNDISQRECYAGLRQARRQGHLPADLDLDAVWKSLKKTGNSTVEVGPFIDFCVSVSRGDDPILAARKTEAPRPTLEPGTPKEALEYMGKEYQAEVGKKNNVGSSSEGKPDYFCLHQYSKADNNKDGKITPDEFKGVCDAVVVERNVTNSNKTVTQISCKSYVEVFSAFDDQSTGSLTYIEFIRLCKSQGDQSKVEALGIDDDKFEKLRVGGKAGESAGSEAGRKAGEEAGRKAGAEAAKDIFESKDKEEEEKEKKEGEAASFVEVASSGMDDMMEWL